MKKLSLFLILTLLLALFTGCGGGNTPESAAPAPESSDPAQSTPVETLPPETTPAETHTQEEIDAVHPMLFHVTGQGDGELYLFGTIHVGDQRTAIARDKLLPYLDACDALAVEFDIVAYENDQEAQLKSIMNFVNTDGSKVSEHMPAETFQKASALLGEAGLFPSLMENYNLAMWAQLVEQAALMTRTDYDMEIGMDRMLIQHCYEKNIPVRDVESAELQYELLAGFPDELNLLLIENTLDNLEDYGQAIDELYAAWLKGDYEEIVGVLNAEDDAEEADLTEEQIALLEDYNDQMLTQRNLGMRDKALQWLQAGDKVFFAVGAAHLVDEGGLVELLRAAGYTVEQVEY